MLTSTGEVLKSLETYLRAPESFSPLKQERPTLHRRQHCALRHAIESISSRMGHAFGPLTIKRRKLQVTLTGAGPEQSPLNGSLGNTVTIWKIIHTSVKHVVESSKDQNDQMFHEDLGWLCCCIVSTRWRYKVSEKIPFL